MLAMHLFFLWSMRSRIARGDPDFTALYTAAKLVRSGQGPKIYDADVQFRLQQAFTSNAEIRRGPLRYIHFPFEALVAVPFSFMPYHAAFICWDFLNFGVLVAAAKLLRSNVLSTVAVSAWDVLLALLAFFPVFANFFQGQDAIFLLLFVLLAFRSLRLQADLAAGCWLALGLFRFQLVVPIVLVLALWGRRKAALGFLTVASALVLSSAAIVGWGTLIQYPGYLWLWTSSPGLGRTPPSLLPSLYGLVTGWQQTDRVHGLLLALVLIGSVSLLVSTVRLRKLANSRQFFSLCFACAILAAVLVGYNTSTYDLVLLALPIAVIAAYAWQRSRARNLRYLVLPAIPLLISPVWFVIGIKWQHFNIFSGFLLWWFLALRGELDRSSTPTSTQLVVPVL